MPEVTLTEAKDVLHQHLEIVRTKAPLNRARGDIAQADLEDRTAASIEAALSLLNREEDDSE